MRYTVDWAPEALATLTTIWMQAADRRAVTAAEAEINRLLIANPLGNGWPLPEGLYAIEAHPLRALFEPPDVRGIVWVVSVSELS
jgi:hypothetical protein